MSSSIAPLFINFSEDHERIHTVFSPSYFATVHPRPILGLVEPIYTKISYFWCHFLFTDTSSYYPQSVSPLPARNNQSPLYTGNNSPQCPPFRIKHALYIPAVHKQVTCKETCLFRVQCSTGLFINQQLNPKVKTRFYLN